MAYNSQTRLYPCTCCSSISKHTHKKGIALFCHLAKKQNKSCLSDFDKNINVWFMLLEHSITNCALVYSLGIFMFVFIGISVTNSPLNGSRVSHRGSHFVPVWHKGPESFSKHSTCSPESKHVLTVSTPLRVCHSAHVDTVKHLLNLSGFHAWTPENGGKFASLTFSTQQDKVSISEICATLNTLFGLDEGATRVERAGSRNIDCIKDRCSFQLSKRH